MAAGDTVNDDGEERFSNYDGDTDIDDDIYGGETDNDSSNSETSRNLDVKKLKLDKDYRQQRKQSKDSNKIQAVKEFKSETGKSRIRIKIEPTGITVENSPKKHITIKSDSPNNLPVKAQARSLLKGLKETVTPPKKDKSKDSPQLKRNELKQIKSEKSSPNQNNVKACTINPVTKARVFNCNRCGEPFPTTVAHNKHLRTKLCFIRNKYDTPKDRFPCKQCSMVFSRQDYLDVHKSVHEESLVPNFGMKFKDINNIIDEIEEADTCEKIKCAFCGQSFFEKRIILHHVIIQHGTYFQCQICEDECETRQKCFTHQRSHDKGTEVAKPDTHKVRCRFCTHSFHDKSSLDKHYLVAHADGKISSFPCDMCKKVFSTQDFLEKHQENIHIRNFVCPQAGCDKGFSTEERMKQHIAVHEDKSFMCTVCGKLFGTRSNFQNHMAVHNNERKFNCDVCGKSYKTKDVLMKHKRIHAETRQYCCEICGWGFNQCGALKKHMDAHLQIKRYNCDTCSQKFTNRASLTNHKLLKGHFNPEDKDIKKAKKCEHCDRRFPPGSAYMYKRHLRTHTGTKPYKCEFCGKAFNDHSNFKYHKLIHTENKPFTCTLCGRGFIQKRGLKKHLEGSTACSSSLTQIKSTKSARTETTSTATFQDDVTSASNSNTSLDVSNVSSSYEESTQRPTEALYTASYSAETVRAAMGLYGVESGMDVSGGVLDMSNNIQQVVWLQKQWK